MSNFDYAYAKLLMQEGFYTNQPNETIYGIDRKESPEWEGWKTVDICRQNPTFPNNMKDISTLKDMANTFTKTKYWDSVNLDLITDKDVASKLLDIGYNEGEGILISCLNRAMVLISHNGARYQYVFSNFKITTDMATRINAESPMYLLNVLRILQAERYLDIIEAEKDPHVAQQYFSDMNGWFNRALR